MISLALLLYVAAALGQVPCRYEVTHIIQGPSGQPPFGTPSTIATGISPSGRFVCGYYTYLIDRYAFLYDTQTNQFTTLPYPPSTFTFAHDVNEEFVVGQGEGLGFVYEIATGQSTLLYPLVDPSVGTCSVNAINASNVVCGTRTMQVPPNTRTTAFRWSEKTGFEDLGLIEGFSTSAEDINDESIVCGWRANVSSSTTARGFSWDGKTHTELPVIPGGSSSACLSINSIGQTCGHGLYPAPSGSGNVVHAFRENGGMLQDLGVLPGFLRSFALDNSDDNTIVGYCRTLTSGADVIGGYVWHAGTMRELSSLLPAGSGISIVVAEALDSTGRIAGQAQFQGVTVAYVITPIVVAGDITGDCRTNVPDLLKVINNWGQDDSVADLDQDGNVGVGDLMYVVEHWTM